MLDVMQLLDTDPDLLTEEESLLVAVEPVETGFYDNLAETLDEKFLDKLGYEVVEAFEEDEASRQDWQYREREGIRLLGVSEETIEGATFEGASEVVYPGLIEAIIQFQSRAIAEIWPSDGPVKSVVMGHPDPEKLAQSQRVEHYMNYLYTDVMPGAFEETDKMLFRLPLSGSAFIKVYYDENEQQLVKRFLPPNDFVVPYEASSIRNAPRWSIVTRYSKNDLRKLQESGYYRDVELGQATDETSQTAQILIDAVDKTDSKERVRYAEGDNHVVFEQLRYMTLPDDEGVGEPYIVHVESESQKVLAIYRNWKEDDPLKKPLQHVVHYKFLPGLGFYGYGYLHILGDLARGETGTLRSLLDAAGFANMPGGMKSHDVRFKNPEIPISPGEWRNTESSVEDLKNAFFPLPYKEPSATLANLLQWQDEVFRRVAGTTETIVGDAPNNAPVGTTLALIEQSQRVQTAVHIRLHKSQRQEFKLLHDLCHQYLDEEYPYDVEGQSRIIKSSDFDGRVDVVPVSDPNVVSATQRIALAQAQLELAQTNPQLYDLYAVNRRLLEAMRVPNIDQILMPPQEVPRLDPISENMNLQTGQPVQAFPDQDHQAHMLVHQTWLQSLDPESLKQVEGPAMAHIAEHMALQYQLQMMQIMGIDQLPEDEAALTMMAAQAAQLMAQQPQQPDPQAMQTEAQIQRNDMQAMADIRRKDQVAQADIARKDAVSIAKMQEDVAKAELDLLQKAAQESTIDRGEGI